MSYIIKNNVLIAEIKETLNSSTIVRYSFATCDETLNANRDKNLVNAQYGKISNAKKWAKVALETYLPVAEQINELEFLLKN